jgi:hypothetical protein
MKAAGRQSLVTAGRKPARSCRSSNQFIPDATIVLRTTIQKSERGSDSEGEGGFAMRETPADHGPRPEIGA